MWWRKKKTGKAMLWVQESIAFKQRGRFTEARKKLEDSVSILRKAKDESLLAGALSELSQVCFHLGDAKQAIRCVSESARIRIALKDFKGLAIDYQMIGTMLMTANQLDQAQGYFSDSLGLATLLGDKTLIAASESNLGLVASVRGSYSEAETHFEKSQAIRKQQGDQLGMAKNLNHLGQIKEATRRFEEAEALYRESLSLLRILGAPEAAIALDNLQKLQRRRI